MNLLDLARSALRDVEAASMPATDPDAPTRRWQVIYHDLPPMEVIFTPEATRAEVAAIYPTARIEPIPEPPRRMATPAEVDELRKLVDRALADDTEANRAEALAAALADVDDALVCFRQLATDLRST